MSLFRHAFKVLRARPFASAAVLFGMVLSSLGQVFTIGSAFPLLQFVAGDASARPLPDKIERVRAALGLGRDLPSLLGLFVVCGGLYVAVSAAFDAYQKKYIRDHERAVRQALVRAVFWADWTYLRAQAHGDLVNAVTREVEYYRFAVKYGLVILSCAFQAAALTAFTLWIHWRFSAAAFALFGAGAALFIPVFAFSRRLGKARLETAGQFTSDLLSSLRAAKSIKAGSLEDYAVETLDAWVERVARIYWKLGLVEVAQIRLNELLSYLSIASLMALGLAVFHVDLPTLMILMLAFYRLLNPLRTAIDAYNQGAAGMPSVEVVSRHLKEASARRVAQGGAPLAGPVLSIAGEGLGFSWPGVKKPLFASLSFKIEQGQFALITGPTGCGKTTLLDLILGLAPPQHGTVAINAVPLEQLDKASWHARIGYLSQESLVFKGTLRSNLLWGQAETFSDARLEEALREAQLDSLLRAPHGLDAVIVESGQNLSGGEKQRLALARILLRRPEVLVFDEPTSALDKATEDQILAVLSGLKGRLTALIVSHQPKFRPLCDQVIELGRLAQPTL